jgi:hypothetical protein
MENATHYTMEKAHRVAERMAVADSGRRTYTAVEMDGYAVVEIKVDDIVVGYL